MVILKRDNDNQAAFVRTIHEAGWSCNPETRENRKETQIDFDERCTAGDMAL